MFAANGCIVDIMQVSLSEISRRYLIAVSSVAAVFGLTMLLTDLVQTDVSALYLAAVMFSAWRGGLAAGLLATVVSVALATFFFLPPIYSFSLKGEGVVELIVFSLAALLVSSLSAAREQALEKERAARQEAESANRVKDEFVAAVSHELRTPLTTIKTLTHLLLRKDPPETERREYLLDISTECERQIDFVHNLLDLSRIEAGGVQISLERVDAEAILKECFEIERVSAEARGHELTLNLESDLPAISADRNALRRAVCAIAENAVKYTPDGGRIEMRSAFDDATGLVLLEISDNGRGIPGDEINRIFERFYRGRVSDNGHSADAQAVSGIGLGLHLASQLIRGMGGTVSASSEPGKGSTFTVRMPVWNELAAVDSAGRRLRTEVSDNG